MTHIARLLFKICRAGRCPTCGKFTRFSRQECLVTGDIPAELEGLVPQVCKCLRNGCTSSVRAITSLELRIAAKEA